MRNSTTTARPEARDYMTIRATAAATGISAFTLRRLLKDGRLPGFYAGNRFMVDVDALRTAIRLGDMGDGSTGFYSALQQTDNRQ